MTSTSSPGSDNPGGDLTEHGADPAQREATGHDHRAPDEQERDDTTAGEVTPAGDLTDHGVDPSSRD